MQLAYEDWAVVENAVARWNAGHQEADFVAAYTVESVGWEASGGGDAPSRVPLPLLKPLKAASRSKAVLSLANTTPNGSSSS